MEPSISRNGGTGETPIRQSCDRCHSQKLRCTRASTDNNTGACARCLTKHVKCIYSFSLPKGRPSVYHLADKSARTGTATGSRNGNGSGSGNGSRNGSKNGRGSGSGDVTESARGNTAFSDHRLPNVSFPPSTLAAVTASSKTGSAESHSDINSDDADVSTHSRHQIVGNYSIFSPKIGDKSTDEPWPWLEGLRWEDLDVETPDNWSGPDSSQATFNWHAFMDSSPAAASASAPVSSSASASASASVSDSGNTTCLAAFPGLMDWASTSGNKTGLGQALPGLQEQGLETSHSEGRIDSSTSEGNGASSNSDNNDPGIVIAQLSQLSIRLSRLHQSSSCPPKDYNPDRPKPVIDDITIQLVATWLVHGSANRNWLPSTQKQDPLPPQIPETKAAGNVLYHLFSASKQLLDILRHMQGNPRDTNSTSFSKSTTPMAPPADSVKSSPHFTPNTGSESSSHSRPPNHHLHNVIHYLLIACYTTLLNIYVSVLKALEHDANLIDHTGAAALGDIGLVSIVQLCSYLTARQHQAIGMYLSAQSPPAVLAWQEHVASDQGFQLYPDAEMRGLKMEVQQRLARLQKTLCF